MRFYPHPVLRILRFPFVIILIVMPLYFIAIIPDYVIGDPLGLQILFGFMAIVGAVVIHFNFWEKLFSVLILSPSEVCWKCLFRRKRIMSLSQCEEIGAYEEFKNNGIPSVQIYFSDHADPQKNMRKRGDMKASEHLIKYEFSWDLCRYILKTYPDSITNCLREYSEQRKKY